MKNLFRLKKLSATLLYSSKASLQVCLRLFSLTDDGRIIPAGSNVFFNFYLTFNDPRYFKNPKVFDPDRFDSDSTKDSMTYTFLPFR